MTLCKNNIGGELFKKACHHNSYFMIKFFTILASLFILSSCRMPDSFGFYQPITLSLEVPDGPPEYKAGWYGGCRSGMMEGRFSNAAAAYKSRSGAETVNGISQHDPAYQTGWGQGWFACVMHTAYFSGNPILYPYGPLE
jgi:hypothetical protein